MSMSRRFKPWTLQMQRPGTLHKPRVRESPGLQHQERVASHKQWGWPSQQILWASWFNIKALDADLQSLVFMKKSLDWQWRKGRRQAVSLHPPDRLTKSHRVTAPTHQEAHGKHLRRVCSVNWKSRRHRGDSRLASKARTGGATSLPLKPGFPGVFVWVCSIISQSLWILISSCVLKKTCWGDGIILPRT